MCNGTYFSHEPPFQNILFTKITFTPLLYRFCAKQGISAPWEMVRGAVPPDQYRWSLFMGPYLVYLASICHLLLSIYKGQPLDQIEFHCLVTLQPHIGSLMSLVSGFKFLKLRIAPTSKAFCTE